MKTYKLTANSLGILLLLSGCSATTQLADGAQAVQIVSEKPQNCKRLGEVEGYKYNLGPTLSLKEIQNSAKNDLKNNASALGANVVEIISTDTIKADMSNKPREYHIQGIAYKCE